MNYQTSIKEQKALSKLIDEAKSIGCLVRVSTTPYVSESPYRRIVYSVEFLPLSSDRDIVIWEDSVFAISPSIVVSRPSHRVLEVSLPVLLWDE